MEKRQLGDSELYVHPIGLGCMSFQSESSSKAIRMIHQAMDLGLNFLDTADLYEYGANEELVGQALRGKRQQVILATKVGNRWQEGMEGWNWDPSKAYIKQQVKRSLKRLNTDYIDLYQLHGGTLDDPIDETIEAFEELQDEGFIRYYGISSIRPNVIREYVQRSNIVSVMSQYSILDRRPEEEILDLLHQNHSSLIARGPLAKGLLTSAWRKKLPDSAYLSYERKELLDLLPKLERWTDERSFTSLALHYVLNHPAVSLAIPGASKPEQLEEILHATGDHLLTNQEIDRIREHTHSNQYEKHR